MEGLESSDAFRASFRNIPLTIPDLPGTFESSSSRSCAWMSLTATSLSSRTCRARYTEPNPPLPRPPTSW